MKEGELELRRRADLRTELQERLAAAKRSSGDHLSQSSIVQGKLLHAEVELEQSLRSVKTASDLASDLERAQQELEEARLAAFELKETCETMESAAAKQRSRLADSSF